MSRANLVVVGDVVLDRDLVGSTSACALTRRCPSWTWSASTRARAGPGSPPCCAAGADVEVTLIAPVADDAAGRAASAGLLTRRGRSRPAGHEGAAPGEGRVRIAGQSLLRLDDGGPATPGGALPGRLCEALEAADVVLVS